ncbi:MAG: hypothetical protein KDI42_04235 [Gammaproteobacteria bacterium]|nr:hypothetical protein [Gammaproteobacteria bacterium]
MRFVAIPLIVSILIFAPGLAAQAEDATSALPALAPAPEPEPTKPASREPEGCGSLQNAVGPYDYREAQSERARGNLGNPSASALIGIDNKYLSDEVQTLASRDAALSIDLALRAFPNHPRALWAAVRNERRQGPPKYGARDRLSVACYIERALTVAGDDGLVWMLWGIYLHQNKAYRDAVVKYRHALELGVESAELNYNLGLALLKVDDVQGALAQARLAYSRDYPLNGLKRKLIKLGVWSQ